MHKRDIRPATRSQYEVSIRLHLVPGLGKHLLAKLEPQHIREFMRAKEASGLSTPTVKLCHSVLRSALSEAESDGLVPRNVARLVTPPPPSNFESQSLTVEQVRQFLEFTRTHRLSALYSVALAIGLRRGETLALTWADVDFEAGTISITGTLARVDGAVTRSEPKPKGSKRTITIPPFLLAALRPHRVKQKEEKLGKGAKWKGNQWDLVFTTDVGTPIDPAVLNVQLGRLLAECKLPHVRLHDFRHTAATLLLAQGVPVNVVSQILGHSNPTTTLNVYAKVLKTQQGDAAQRMDNLLFGS